MFSIQCIAIHFVLWVHRDPDHRHTYSHWGQTRQVYNERLCWIEEKPLKSNIYRMWIVVSRRKRWLCEGGRMDEPAGWDWIAWRCTLNYRHPQIIFSFTFNWTWARQRIDRQGTGCECCFTCFSSSAPQLSTTWILSLFVVAWSTKVARLQCIFNIPNWRHPLSLMAEQE